MVPGAEICQEGGGGHDLHALIALHLLQVTVPADDELGAGCEGAGNILVIFRVVPHNRDLLLWLNKNHLISQKIKKFGDFLIC